MKVGGVQRTAPMKKVASFAIIAAAIGVGAYALHRSAVAPSTDDASIDAEVVHVAAAVGGRLSELPIEENALVAKGDLLFRIDQVPYQLAVTQAEADVELARAELETRRRALDTQRSAVVVATAQA